MKKLKPNAHLHLTLEERRIILSGINNASSKTAIAETIGKTSYKRSSPEQ